MSAATLTSIKMSVKQFAELTSRLLGGCVCVCVCLVPVPDECVAFLAVFLAVRKWYFLTDHSFSWQCSDP